ncbi:MAG: SurA N-terminal domain-containing protein [Elusimicrobia bacterium]|nr:SurA N-terminal domain-containing protein [Elusimicrobiota bacterium]
MTQIRLLSAAAALVLTAGPAKAQETSEAAAPVATVNGDVITRGEFDRAWNAALEARKAQPAAAPLDKQGETKGRRALLRRLIEQRLLLQEAKRRGVDIPTKAVDERVAAVMNRFSAAVTGPGGVTPAQAFEAELAKRGLTRAAYEEGVREELLRAKLLQQIVEPQLKTPGEEELRKLYGEALAAAAAPKREAALPAREDFDELVRRLRAKTGERVRFRYLLVEEEAKAKELAAKIAAGESFAALARGHSLDRPSGARGGDAGFAARGDVPELDETLFSLAVGALSPPVKTSRGWHILRVEEKKAKTETTFEESRPAVISAIKRAHIRAEYAKLLARLRKTAAVQFHGTYTNLLP